MLNNLTINGWVKIQEAQGYPYLYGGKEGMGDFSVPPG